MNRLEAFVDATIAAGRNNTYYHHNAQPMLSIKTMHNDMATYTIEGGRFAVSDQDYLILNENQAYTIEIESHKIVQSFCVFFPSGWAEDVWRSLTKPADILLDTLSSAPAVNFFERLYVHDALVTPLVRAIERKVASSTTEVGELEEAYRKLLARLLHVQFEAYREAEDLPAARAATRQELYRRLYRARDYIHASLQESLTLDEIAAVAYLSPYHFLRSFKQVFGLTPHAYLTQARLERAMFLLRATDLSVTEICLEVGFESLGSFSTRFQRHTGASPRTFRQQLKISS